jgi:hypothetical protein
MAGGTETTHGIQLGIEDREEKGGEVIFTKEKPRGATRLLRRFFRQVLGEQCAKLGNQIPLLKIGDGKWTI